MDSYSTPPARPSIRRKLPRHAWIAPVVVFVAVMVSWPHSRRVDEPVSPVAFDGVPAYFIAGTGATDPPYTPYPRHLGIYATATGARVARLSLPASHPYVDAVSVAADDRTFLYAAVDDYFRARFFLARFDPATGTVSYSAVRAPMPAHTELEGLALSPDGSKVAYVYAWRLFHDRYGLTVFDIATAKSRTWSTSSRYANTDRFENFNGVPLSVSWASDNVTVAFNWFGLVPGHDGEQLVNSGLRLVDTTEPGGNLIADSRVAVRYVLKVIRFKPVGRAYIAATSAGYLSGVAVLAPGGRTVVAGIRTFPSGRDGEFASFSAASGKLGHVVDRQRSLTWYAQGGALQVLWASSDGHTLIVITPPGLPGRIEVLRGSHPTTLRQPPTIVLPLAAW